MCHEYSVAIGWFYLAAQQAPCWMFRSAALGGVFGFVLVVVGFVVLDDVILATEESDDTCEGRRGQNALTRKSCLGCAFTSSPAHMMSTTTMMMSSPALSWVVWSTSSIVTSSDKDVNTISAKIHLFLLNTSFKMKSH